MPLPERVLLDTSALYALLSTTDAFHQEAKETYERLIDREQQLWTTSYILVEMNWLIYKRLGFGKLHEFMDSVTGVAEVLWIERTIHEEAWSQFINDQGKSLGFVDWTTATASRQLKAPVFTFDQGFTQQGIPVIPR